MIDNVRIGGAPVNGDATTFRQKSTAALLPIRPQWKLRWLGRLIRLKNADEFSPAAVDIAWALAECFYEKSLAEVSCSFLARKTGLSKRWVVHGIGELERVPNTVIVRARGQWQGRVKSKYAMVLTPEDLGPDAAKLGVTGPVASDTWVNEPSPTRVNEGSPTRVNAHSPNYTNSPKQREGEVVSADAGLAPFGGSPAQRSKAASDGAASFEAFKAAYPRKEGWAAARKAFDTALARDVSAETLIDGARRYAAAKEHVDPNWLKFPATWLRDECWREDPQPPRRKEPKLDRRASGKAAPVAEPELDDDARASAHPELIRLGGDGAVKAFAAFWEAYPRKEDRASAEQTFACLSVFGASFMKKLPSKAREYAAANADVAVESLKMPAAWLNDRIDDDKDENPWADEPEREPKPKGKTGKPVWSRNTGTEGRVVSERGDLIEICWLGSGERDWYYRSDMSFTGTPSPEQ